MNQTLDKTITKIWLDRGIDLEIAQEIAKLEVDKFSKMRCPCCKSQLEFNDVGKYESLGEHIGSYEVSDKASYRCGDVNCPTRNIIDYWGNPSLVCWTSDGETYGGSGNGINYIDGNSAPFGTHERKMNVELKPEKKYIKINKKFKILVEKYFKSDFDGNKLKSKYEFRILKENCYWTPPIFTFIRLLFNGVKYALTGKGRVRNGMIFKDHFSKDNRWQYRKAHNILKKIFPDVRYN